MPSKISKKLESSNKISAHDSGELSGQVEKQASEVQGTVKQNRQNRHLRVALIGYGLGGSVFHAPIIAVTPGLELKAIVTSNDERAQQANKDHPRAKILADSSEIFASAGEYDLVVVAAPNRFHFPLAKAALEAGLAVVVDKPVATNSADVRSLIEMSKKRSLPFTVYHNRRFDSDFLTLRKIIDKKMLGELTRFESRFERFRPALKSGWKEQPDPQEAGGLLFDLGSHLIDQACVLFGRPKSVYAEVRCVRPGALVDDDVFIALQFEHGLQAHIWATCVARIGGPRYKLHGMKGSFEKYGLDPQEDALRIGIRADAANWGREPESIWGRLCTTYDGIVVDGRVESESGCYPQFYANVRDALLGKVELAVKPEETLVTMEVIEAAFKSAGKMRTVSL